MDLEVPEEIFPEESSLHKKGRKKNAIPVEEFDPLPEKATEGKSPEAIEELQTANKLLQTIFRMKNISAFYNKPNPDSFGMSAYNRIVKKPMWLAEVKRKLDEGEYNGILDLVNDVRLLLENCYKFWGINHRITNKGINMEVKLEQYIDQLPIALQEKLRSNYCMTVVKNEPSDTEDFNGFDDDSIHVTKGYQSKIMGRVLENEECESEEDSEFTEKLEREMLTWERENLVNETTELEIKAMWQKQIFQHMCEMSHFRQIQNHRYFI